MFSADIINVSSFEVGHILLYCNVMKRQSGILNHTNYDLMIMNISTKLYSFQY